MKKSIIVLSGLLFITSACFARESNDVQIGRYTTVTAIPKKAQQDLLSQTVQVRFPQNVQTIGDAMNYLLRFSGYSLIPEAKQSQSLKLTLSKPLPAIDRDFGPMVLKDALITLAGSAFSLEQDPLNRQINFKLKPEYARYLDGNRQHHKK